MILIFNVYAILPLAFGVVVGFLLAQSTHPLVGVVVGAAVAAGVDVLQRFANRDNARWPLVEPRAGGHLFFIPVWALSVLVGIMSGLVKSGALSQPPDPARPVVVQKGQQPPNRQQLLQKEKRPEPAEKKVEGAAPEKLAKGPDIPLKGRHDIRPERPAFAKAVVKRIALENGSVKVVDEYGADDAADRGTPMPVKIYEIALEADKAYWLETKPASGPSNQRLRIEDREGRVLAECKEDRLRQQSKLLYIAPKTDDHRVIVSARFPPGGRFALEIKEVLPGDSLPESERLAPPDTSKINMQVALQTESFLSAAIAADCQSAWVAFPMGKLERFSCPDFVVTASYRFPREAYQLAMNGRGLLCAVVQRAKAVQPARPERPGQPKRAGTRPGQPKQPVRPMRTPQLPGGLGLADIHVYDTRSFSKQKKTITPKHVISVGGIIEHLLISPDDAWLYFLDTHNRKVGRINLAAGKLDKENAEIASDTKAMCLTADGKARYTCAASNVVQKLDPATLGIDKTIRLDKGTPRGIQATNDGDVFLKSGEGQWTHIYLVNANRDYGEETAKVSPWVGVYHQHSILLSPDQTLLFGACFSTSPSNITSYHVARQPALYRAEACGSIRLDGRNARGTMSISRDGRFLFCDRGLILTLGR